MAAIMLWVHTMKGIAARDTQQRGALIACNGLPSGSIPSIRKNQPELSHHDAVYRIYSRLSMRNLRLETTDEDVLAVIVFGAVRHRPKFHSRHLLLFQKETRPTSMVPVGDTSLQKRAGLLEHRRLFVVPKDDAVPVGSFFDRRSCALKELCSRLSNQTFRGRVIGFRLGLS